MSIAPVEEGPARPAFPVIGVIAPLLASGLLALVFQSTLALALGLLGPVIALAHWWEALRAHRRATVAQQERREQELRLHDLALAEQEHEFRRQQRELFPPIDQALSNPLWRPTLPPETPRVRVGLGARPLVLGGTSVKGIPVSVDLLGGIAVVGRGPRAQAVWRAIALSALVIAQHRGWEVLAGVVEKDVEPPDVLDFRVEPAWERNVWLRRVDQPSDVDQSISTVISCGQAGVEILVGGIVGEQGIMPDQLSFSSWRHFISLGERASSPAGGNEAEIPDHDDHARTRLWCRLSDDYVFDLVSEGPHALVWGQTGSGKSVALTTLLSSVVGRYSPEQVSFAMIDFKGGTGIGALVDSAHCVGVVTDLMPRMVPRAARGIDAEIIRREQILASHRVSDIALLDPSVVLPRILIVIDEVALLLQRHPEWELLISDLAARGRALGVHLIVAGQRVLGQVPRAVVVNAPIRLCLKILDPAEGTDFLPGVTTSQLLALRQSPPGSFLGVTASRGVTMGRVTMNHQPSPRPGTSESLWRDPLPSMICPTDPIVSGLPAWAVLDEPLLASYRTLTAEDRPVGLVVLTGDPETGHSSAIRALASSVPETQRLFLPPSPEDWVNTVYELRRGRWPEGLSRLDPVLVVSDRLDRVFRHHTPDQLEWIVDLVADLAADLVDVNAFSTCVVSVTGQAGWARSLGRRQATLISLPSTHRELWATRESQATPIDTPRDPGRGWWNGLEIHFVFFPEQRHRESALPIPHLIEVAAVGETPGVIVDGDPGATDQLGSWTVISADQSDLRWRDIEQARRSGRLVLRGLTLDHAKSLAGAIGAYLPATSPQHGWLMQADGPRLVRLGLTEAVSGLED